MTHLSGQATVRREILLFGLVSFGLGLLSFAFLWALFPGEEEVGGTQLLDRPTTGSSGVVVPPIGVAFVGGPGAETVASAELASVEVWSTSSGERIDRWDLAGGEGSAAPCE